MYDPYNKSYGKLDHAKKGANIMTFFAVGEHLIMSEINLITIVLWSFKLNLVILNPAIDVGGVKADLPGRHMAISKQSMVVSCDLEETHTQHSET